MKKKDEKYPRPLLDVYIQKRNKETQFDGMEDEEIAKAIRTLLHKDSVLPKDLN